MSQSSSVITVGMIKKMAATCVMKKNSNICDQGCKACTTNGAHFVDTKEWMAAICEAETDWFNEEYKLQEKKLLARLYKYNDEKRELQRELEKDRKYYDKFKPADDHGLLGGLLTVLFTIIIIYIRVTVLEGLGFLPTLFMCGVSPFVFIYLYSHISVDLEYRSHRKSRDRMEESYKRMFKLLDEEYGYNKEIGKCE
jgi:hypothetical protein